MAKLYKVVLNVFEANMNISTSNGTFVAYTPYAPPADRLLYSNTVIDTVAVDG